jgi:hypothetical protein
MATPVPPVSRLAAGSPGWLHLVNRGGTSCAASMRFLRDCRVPIVSGVAVTREGEERSAISGDNGLYAMIGLHSPMNRATT